MTHFLSGEGAGLYLYHIYWFRNSFSDNPFSLHTIFIVIRVGSRTLAASEVELFLIIIDSFQPFAFVIRNSMSDLAGFLGLPLFDIIIL